MTKRSRVNMDVSSRLIELENDLRDNRSHTDAAASRVDANFEKVNNVLGELARSVARLEENRWPSATTLLTVTITTVVGFIAVIGSAVAAMTYISSASSAAVRTEMVSDQRVMQQRINNLERLVFSDHRLRQRGNGKVSNNKVLKYGR